MESHQKNSSRRGKMLRNKPDSKRRTQSTKGRSEDEREEEKIMQSTDNSRRARGPSYLKTNASDMNELFRFGRELLDGLSLLRIFVVVCSLHVIFAAQKPLQIKKSCFFSETFLMIK